MDPMNGYRGLRRRSCSMGLLEENSDDFTPAFLNTLNKFLWDSLYSISAGTFRKCSEWNSKLAFAFVSATVYPRCSSRAHLLLLRGPQCQAQLFPESAVRTEEPQPHGHGRNSHTLGRFLGRVLQNVS